MTQGQRKRRAVLLAVLSAVGLAIVAWVVWPAADHPTSSDVGVRSPPDSSPRKRPIRRAISSDDSDLAFAMDEVGVRLVGDSGGDDESRIWVMPLDKSPTSIVKPSPSGRFGLPTELESRPVRLFAQRLSVRGSILESDHIWTRKDLSGATVVFRRAAPCRLRVNCRDDLGAPVAATIKIERILGTDLVTVLSIDTDQSGALDGVVEGPGRYQVTPIVVAPGDAPQAVERQEIDLDAQRTGLVSFVVERTAHLIVSVRDESGSPTSKAQVNFKRRADGAWQPIPASGSVDDEGTRVVPKLRPGDYLLQCIAPQRDPVVSEFTLSAGEERTITVPMRSGGMGAHGRIQAPSFDLHAADALSKSAFLLRRDTDARYVIAFWTICVKRGGEFSASGLLAGEYELRVFEGEWFACNVRIDQPDTDLGTITIPRDVGDRAIELSLDTPAPYTMSFTALLRSESWPRGIARTVTISRSSSPTVIDGLGPGRYEVGLSPAGVDPLTFDIQHTETVELAETGGSLGRVKLSVPRR